MILKTTALILCISIVLSLNGQLRGQKCDACTKRGIRMAISLAAGTIRTPEFEGKGKYYNINIDAKWLLPPEELKCRMGFAVVPSDSKCKQAPLLDLEWRVLEGRQVVAEGVDKGVTSHFEADSEWLTRNVGSFLSVAHHKYVVEITVKQDASVLNVTQPRLIVEQPGFSM
jgi:hypothetical protein